jgi:hypothetical protein
MSLPVAAMLGTAVRQRSPTCASWAIATLWPAIRMPETWFFSGIFHTRRSTLSIDDRKSESNALTAKADRV